MLTQGQLKQTGFDHRILNGTIDEWSMPLFGLDDAPLSNCIVIRFNEWKDEPFTVYLIVGPQLAGSMVRLRHVDTIEKVVKVVEALKGKVE